MPVFRFGIVGLGLGSAHAQKILTHPGDWELAVVCDALAERVERFTTQHPEVQGYSDFTRMLAEVDLDGVILALPHDLHAPLAIEAMEAGKHVLVEKPMARSTAECREMNDVARRTSRTLMVGQNWRYTPWVRAVKNLVDHDELGPLRAVRTDWIQNAVGDKRPGNWLLDGIRAGGGPIISLTVHNLDFLRYVLGEPTRVHSFCLTGHPAFANHAENWAMAQCSFQNGVIGQIFTSYSAFSPIDTGPLWLYGEEGTIYHQNGELHIASRRRGKEYQTLQIVGNAGLPTENPSINELLHFVECATTGAEPLSSGNDNIKTVQFIEALYNSAKSGEAISL